MAVKIFNSKLTNTLIIIFLIISLFLFSQIPIKKCTCHKPIRSFSMSSKHTLAVLVPYRNRFEELLTFVPHIHNFLNKQNIDHDIIILNQIDPYRFNRASLINVGYLFTQQTHDYIAMHDIDLLPLNDELKYNYPEQPLHISASFHPKHKDNIGGILLINSKQFHKVNGMSNKYWGWGREEREFYKRLKAHGLNITKPTIMTTNVSSNFKHNHGDNRKRDMLPCFSQYEMTKTRDFYTGLNTIKYEVKDIKQVTIENAPLTILNIKLHCNMLFTPWCTCVTFTKYN